MIQTEKTIKKYLKDHNLEFTIENIYYYGHMNGFNEGFKYRVKYISRKGSTMNPDEYVDILDEYGT